jgi:nitrous oxide reductase accessory protein NosL
MFVYKYPDWLAQIVYTDGTVVFFDGAKDLFKYYLGLKTQGAGRTPAQIDGIYVTDYYDLKPIEARGAFFVVGSNVYGPMGKELVPLKERQAAEEFLRDHGGKAIVAFGDVNPALLKTLD